MSQQFEQSYFDKYYGNYALQNPARKLDFYLRQIEAQFAPGKDLDLLEIGCGLGRFLTHVSQARSFYRLSATDVSEFGIEHTRKAVPQARFALASAEEQVFEPASFDAICSFDVIEHVPDLGQVLSSVFTMLRPGGVFVFVVPVYDGLSGPIIRLLDKDPTHLHKWPRRRWHEWAGQSLQLVDWLGVLRYLVPRIGYLHVPTRWGRAHTPAILAVYRKPH